MRAKQACGRVRRGNIDTDQNHGEKAKRHCSGAKNAVVDTTLGGGSGLDAFGAPPPLVPLNQLQSPPPAVGPDPTQVEANDDSADDVVHVEIAERALEPSRAVTVSPTTKMLELQLELALEVRFVCFMRVHCLQRHITNPQLIQYLLF